MATEQISIAFTLRQIAALRDEANRLGVPIAEVVRRLMDAWIDGKGKK